MSCRNGLPVVFLGVPFLVLAALLFLPGSPGAEADWVRADRTEADRTDTVPPGVLAAATSGLPRFLSAITPGEMEHFRFAGEGEIARAELGSPFQVHCLRPDEILDFADGKTGEVTIEPMSLWQFPVLCDGSIRTLLTVDQVDGGWEAVDLGGFSPAYEMEEVAFHWPPGEGYGLRYVRVFPTGSQFIAVTRENQTRFVPLESTARSLGLIGYEDAYYYEPFEVERVVEALAPELRTSLGLGRP